MVVVISPILRWPHINYPHQPQHPHRVRPILITKSQTSFILVSYTHGKRSLSQNSQILTLMKVIFMIFQLHS